MRRPRETTSRLRYLKSDALPASWELPEGKVLPQDLGRVNATKPLRVTRRLRSHPEGR